MSINVAIGPPDAETYAEFVGLDEDGPYICPECGCKELDFTQGCSECALHFQLNTINPEPELNPVDDFGKHVNRIIQKQDSVISQLDVIKQYVCIFGVLLTVILVVIAITSV